MNLVGDDVKEAPIDSACENLSESPYVVSYSLVTSSPAVRDLRLNKCTLPQRQP
ncbi:MAG TPA: hypothetical protein VL361_16950 [Candidatus Limnocylindrales bacterium]|jgi:hypothetical protein|nr:hypothetical protein [Candidatus Limnocylindrales bacterium]